MFGKKSDNTYRARVIASVPADEKWDALNEMGGAIYEASMRIKNDYYEATGESLDDKTMRHMLTAWLAASDYQCHSHSADTIRLEYVGAFKSFLAKKKKDPTAKPPYRTGKFHTFAWRSTAISAKGKMLRLSMGRGAEPILLPIAEKRFQGIVPAVVKLVYNRNKRCYDFKATYEVQRLKRRETGSISAVDMGEIHPIVDFNGDEATVYNGRFLRSIVQYRHKFLARINQKLSRCKRGSRRWRYLKRTKRRVLQKLAHQIRDARHKITSRYVSAARESGAKTIVLGNLKHIRKRMRFGKKTNQKLHAWPFAELADMITYKADAVGIETEHISEAYTSQECPQCRHRYKPKGRVYRCRKCGWTGHRDVVGASNLWTKYKDWLVNPVVGAVAAPSGVRFHWHLCRLDKGRSFGRLISKKPPTKGVRTLKPPQQHADIREGPAQLGLLSLAAE